jgi:hypothetical protein
VLPYVGCYEERYRLTCRIAGSLAFSLVSLAAGISSLCRSEGFVPRVRRSHRPASRGRACQPHDRVPRLMMVRLCPRSARSRTSGCRAWVSRSGNPPGTPPIRGERWSGSGDAQGLGWVRQRGERAGVSTGRQAGGPTRAARRTMQLHRSGCPAVTDGLIRFRESQILLRRVRGAPMLPRACSPAPTWCITSLEGCDWPLPYQRSCRSPPVRVLAAGCTR